MTHRNNHRIVTCENCGGDGGFESMPYGYNHYDGSPLTHWNQCSACGGSGENWIEVQPTEMDEPDNQPPPEPRERIAPSAGCCSHGYNVNMGALCPVCDS